ncbi:Substrate-specific component PanT of putative pantothenate ECF transporter [Streptococcus sp. DD10]|uniref:ECF transporter S component n=1 Tax=Streptococcus sp. DD10 TaxID=1777878 RepID=UPI000793E1CF|nr:ECF transporter S component [Streptococcus sp. DD10]KXT75134.1 Substrate-specific component PanT of putative pantothenate ECF transporter [Streptococcus sp. DD10]
MKKQSNIAQIAIFFSSMVVIHVLSSSLFRLLPIPISPTIVHIPVIIASIIYGPRVGIVLGFLMGCISLISNTVQPLPSSYLFSPFVPNGNLLSLVITFAPRILIGVTPFYTYKFLNNRVGLFLSGFVGSLTNTVFVLGAIFLFFSGVYQGNIQLLLAGILTTNSLLEMTISTVLTAAIVPKLEKLRK